jgi:hypothetical protein
MGGKIAIERPPGHTKALADTLHGGCPGFIQLERHGKGIRGDRLGASPTAATLACADQAGHGAFPDEMAFELGKRTRYVQEKLTCRGRRINRLHQALEANPTLVQRIDHVNQVT